MKYSAHSPNVKRGIGSQPYEVHVTGVFNRAVAILDDVCKHATIDSKVLSHVVRQAALFHDLGKLDEANQSILLGERTAKKLPVNHVDAGVAHSRNTYEFTQASVVVATIIQAHHIGYCDFIREENKKDAIFRDTDIMEHTNKALSNYVSVHNSLVTERVSTCDIKIKGELSIFLRMALSCLADADHTDTSIHYSDHAEPPPYISLNPEKRLEKLDEYVNSLKKSNDERSKLRSEMYEACKNADISAGVASCDSPVGSGKTTAIMAHLLKQASKRNLRRIIIVLPFTNIIQQSVKVYREALALEGEDSSEIVAELHHRADFKDKESRHFTALWYAPIIVTTAVAFFETIASNSPSTLRCLHELPGSAIFIDESHAALPVKLLPLALHWINRYSIEWNCYWVMASGSLNRFWDIEEINRKQTYTIPELVNTNLRNRLSFYEKSRIKYQYDSNPKGLGELSGWIISHSGPRLLIVNTVQNAAIIADYFFKTFGRNSVEHLSTALMPVDRDKTIKKIRIRLSDKDDTNWTLVATSCIEAGVDISFRTGFRELSSLMSLLQTAGRVNRGGKHEDSEIWTFKLKNNDNFNANPELKTSRAILQKYLETGEEIIPELSTKSINDEIKTRGVSSAFQKLLESEQLKRFPDVEKSFKVINTDTRLVIADKKTAKAIANYQKISWQEIQKYSVNIYGYNLDKYAVSEFMPGMYKWMLEYDDFLGIMAGALPVVRAIAGEGLII